MDTMSGAILDELTEMTRLQKNGLPLPRGRMTETVIGTIVVMAVYVGIILAFLSNF